MKYGQIMKKIMRDDSQTPESSDSAVLPVIDVDIPPSPISEDLPEKETDHTMEQEGADVTDNNMQPPNEYKDPAYTVEKISEASNSGAELHAKALCEVTDKLDNINNLLAALDEKFDRMDKIGEVSTRQAQLLQSQSNQVRKLQDNEYQNQVVLPLLKVFIEAIDTLDSEKTNIPNEGTAAEYKDRYRELLAYLDEHFTATLKRYGMEKIEPAPLGSKVDPSIQRVVAVKTVPAPTDGVVIRTIRTGYIFNGNVERSSEVEVQKTKQEEML